MTWRAFLIVSIFAGVTWIAEAAKAEPASSSSKLVPRIDENEPDAHRGNSSTKDDSDGGDEEVQRSRAAESFERGLSLVREGQLEQALGAFQQAHELSPHRDALYNIALTYEKLGLNESAIRFYEEYLDWVEDEAGPDRANAERVVEVQARLFRLKESLPASKERIEDEDTPAITGLRFSVQPPDAVVKIDGSRHREPTLVEVAPGKHVVSFSAPGYLEQTSTVEVPPEQTVVVAATLSRKPKQSPLRPPDASATEERAGGSWTQRTVGVGLGAAGIALLGTSLSIFFWNDARHTTWKKEKSELEELPSDDLTLDSRRAVSDSELRAIQSADQITWVTGIAGGVFLASGVVTYFLRPNEERQGWSLAPTGVSYRATF